MVNTPPTSGSEHKFTKRKWGGKIGKNNNNCYAYAVHDYQKYRNWKSQPGERAGMSNSGKYLNCGKLPKMVVADNPKKVYMVKAGTKCRPSYYKIMLFVAACKRNDYMCRIDEPHLACVESPSRFLTFYRYTRARDLLGNRFLPIA